MTQLLSLREARAAVLCAASELETTEAVGLHEACGRVLAVDVRSAGPWPATDRSAMDGFAVVAGAAGIAAGATLPVVGESLAGRPFEAELIPGNAIRIMTGAVVPSGADAVVPVELTSGYAGARVTLVEGARRGGNIRLRGSELPEGAMVLRCGTRIRPAEIGVLAVLGHGQITVRRRPEVAILSTGDEVVPLEASPAPHQVRDSNSHALAAQVASAGAVPVRLGIARDTIEDTTERMVKGLATCDVLLTIGGISEGTHDLVQDRLIELGVQKVFQGIALKPGKPTFFGWRENAGRRQYVFGLPGNPASCFTVFDLLVLPLLQRILGESVGQLPAAGGALISGAAFKSNKRLQAIPARIALCAGAQVEAELGAPKTSGDPFSLCAGNGYVLIPENAVVGAATVAEIALYEGRLQPR